MSGIFPADIPGTLLKILLVHLGKAYIMFKTRPAAESIKLLNVSEKGKQKLSFCEQFSVIALVQALLRTRCNYRPCGSNYAF